jgi:5-methylcytosine-specific restriction endonuclease McrA
MPPTKRPDRYGPHRKTYEEAKKIIFATEKVCYLCGKPVDFSLKPPHPLSPSIDHVIPIDKGGSPDDIDNLRLAHRTCNRAKGVKLLKEKEHKQGAEFISNRVLPQAREWSTYRS